VQVDYLQAHPEVDYVVARLQNFLEPGCERPAWLRPELLEHDQVGVSTCTLLARRGVFERIGGFDTRFPVGDDTDWFARAQVAGLVSAVMPDVLLQRRIHDRNHTTETLDACRSSALRILKASLDRRRQAGSRAPGTS
jgi:GT2 family glycosyltransferase